MVAEKAFDEEEVAVPGLSLDTAGEPLVEAADECGASGEKVSMVGNQIRRFGGGGEGGGGEVRQAAARSGRCEQKQTARGVRIRGRAESHNLSGWVETNGGAGGHSQQLKGNR